MRYFVILAASVALLPAQSWFGRNESFSPRNKLTGIGLDREKLSEYALRRRAELMTESQTFGILRDPQALEGAERITGPRLKRVFEQASRDSGLPVSFISAVAYLESWGIANAQSPAGPKGIMQIAGATGRSMGLRTIYSTRYRTEVQRRAIQPKRRGGKVTYRTVKVRVPYQVLVRDERLVPELAVPAAARYLARLENQYGGRDWAIFAYHCGEGCVASVRNIVKRSDGMSSSPTVAEAFFNSSPVHNRELYEAMQYHMDRDFSPTYYFRIRRAEQLLQLYEEKPEEFQKLFAEYRNQVTPEKRAPHRLSVWLKPEDLSFKTCEDLKRESGRKLVRAFDDSKYFGFALRRTGMGALGEEDPQNREYYLQASPSVIGTIAYISYETRRLFEKMKGRNDKFVPIEVTALVQPLDYEERVFAKRHGTGKPELPTHCSGLVFDLNYSSLPQKEREALEFVLQDMGWDGYLGFVRDSAAESTYHIGAAPSARDFFTRVYEEALASQTESD
ncbi:MAG TPA: transglycosylase SLT domain-containing protein [Bryobacteraceae bacterium]|nr:transglycosylase SLT domain-containing protein [Bryobacteraceae bacterium]